MYQSRYKTRTRITNRDDQSQIVIGTNHGHDSGHESSNAGHDRGRDGADSGLVEVEVDAAVKIDVYCTIRPF